MPGHKQCNQITFACPACGYGLHLCFDGSYCATGGNCLECGNNIHLEVKVNVVSRPGKQRGKQEVDLGRKRSFATGKPNRVWVKEHRKK